MLVRTVLIGFTGIAASVVPAHALVAPVPEIGATGSLAALAAVGAVIALIYERRRRK